MHLRLHIEVQFTDIYTYMTFFKVRQFLKLFLSCQFSLNENPLNNWLGNFFKYAEQKL